MTRPDEVTVTDAEVDEIHEAIGQGVLSAADRLHVRKALAAFLAARVPDADKDVAFGDDIQFKRGHNALRDAVLRGLDQ